MNLPSNYEIVDYSLYKWKAGDIFGNISANGEYHWRDTVLGLAGTTTFKQNEYYSSHYCIARKIEKPRFACDKPFPYGY